MKVAHCPACGAIVSFHVSTSLVTICEYCHSALARGDKQLEDLGKVADLVDTESPLRLGAQGHLGNKSYEIVGRVQYRHTAGGVWDEWYLSMGGDRWGWLAEAQGRFYVTYAVPRRDSMTLPTFDEIEVGQSYNLGPKVGVLKVAEKNVGTAASAEGEIPWHFQPGAAMRFADLYGHDSAFATLDYSEAETQFYLGKEMSLADLGIVPNSAIEERPAKTVKALQLNCPKCGGPLELHAPDQAQRVSCPNCRALLDVSQGNLRYLTTLNKSRIQPLIPLGTTGTISGLTLTVIGFLVRSVTEEEIVYRWQEYLLYNSASGFHWLVHSDDHWNFVSAVSPGEVDDQKLTAAFAGKSFRLFQVGVATVRAVFGEFYWKVGVGEQVKSRDYIAPPFMLSFEASENEENISLGAYMPPETIEAAFGVQNLRRPWSVGPNQPGPRIARVWTIGIACTFFLFVLNSLLTPKTPGSASPWLLIYAIFFVLIVPIGASFYAWSFETRRWQNSNVR